MRHPLLTPARYARLAPYVLALVMAAVAILYSASYTNGSASRLDAQARVQAATIRQLRAQQLAGCAFARDLGTVPVPDKPRPSKLGISLVTDSRAQWRGLHCPGTLPVPPGLAKWAAVYHLSGK